ncbi:hypothetical protein J7M00_02460 [bacterium]|nr:hypothetical protein [bacterium]
MHLKDLEGKSVKILRASEDEIVIEVGGRKYRIEPDYECYYYDCSGPEDPSSPFLVIEEVEE